MKFEKFEFINNFGKKIKYSCDKSKLANNFGTNKETPYYLMPIFFKKEVLDKYYNKHSKYSVEDGALFCGTLWMIHIDNNQIDCVMVYLGDLGELPHEEQQYWKLYNILKGEISSTSFKRDFQAEFCSPTEPALFFKEKMGIFNKKWEDKFGWHLFRPLNMEDEHHFKTLKIPDNEQKEFDEKVLSLTKILIESINSEEIKKGVNLKKGAMPIEQLEEYLKQKHSLNSSQMFEFLRKLQKLRSKDIHFKNEEYNEIYSYFDKGSLSKTFERIIINSIFVLNTIENKVFGEKNETKTNS